MKDFGQRYRRYAATPPTTLGARLTLTLLRPLGWSYGALMTLRAAAYRRGWLVSWKAPVPVIAVGNLALGGTGKTPLVDWLIRLLQQDGWRVGVVSRGYGRQPGSEPVIVSRGAGPEVGPTRGGDEPCLLAQRNPGAIVTVAARRRLAIEQAVALGAEVVILDDGFQHLAVRRDLNLLVLDGRAPFGNGAVFPAGLLRERTAALARADLAILNGEGGLPEEAPALPLLRCHRHLAQRARAAEGSEVPLAELASRRLLAFAGIAEPERFFAQLTQAGLPLAATLALPDHASYHEVCLAQLRRQAETAEVLLTTEKDAVKLQGIDLGRPCYAVPLEIRLEPAEILRTRVRAVMHENKEMRMELNPKLLELLACPQCKGPVALREGGAALRCPACRLDFPVRDGIPVMLLDEATPLADDGR